MIFYMYSSINEKSNEGKFFSLSCIGDALVDFVISQLPENIQEKAKELYTIGEKVNINGEKIVVNGKVKIILNMFYDYVKAVEEKTIVERDFFDFIYVYTKNGRIDFRDKMSIKYYFSKNDLNIKCFDKKTNTKIVMDFSIDDEAMCDLSNFAYTIEKGNTQQREKESKDEFDLA